MNTYEKPIIDVVAVREDSILKGSQGLVDSPF